MFAVVLLIFGLLGALWSTVFAVLEYRAERLAAFDQLLHQVLFEEILPSHVQPNLTDRMAHFAPCTPARLFTALCLSQQLTAAEFDAYTSLAKDSLCRRRLWFPRAFIARRVDDVAPQYVWRTTGLMPRLLNHLAGGCGLGAAAATPS